MDREARQEYNVVIQAKDMGGHMGGLSGTTEVKITLTDVNDNPPKFPQSKLISSLSLCTIHVCHTLFNRHFHFHSEPPLAATVLEV